MHKLILAALFLSLLLGLSSCKKDDWAGARKGADKAKEFVNQRADEAKEAISEVPEEMKEQAGEVKEAAQGVVNSEEAQKVRSTARQVGEKIEEGVDKLRGDKDK